MKTSKKLAMLLAVVGMTACNTDLKIEDLNAPNTTRAVSNAGDVQTLIGGSIEVWYTGSQDIYPSAAFATMSDAMTSSYGNFGMRFNSNEPVRIAYNNSSSNDDGDVANVPWAAAYQVLGQANDGLNALKTGVTIMKGEDDVTDEYEAIGRFLQGAALGDLALNFDKAFVNDETTPIPAPMTFVPYQGVSTAAIDKLNTAIGLTANKTWTIPLQYLNLPDEMTAGQFGQLMNTMVARLLAYTPRTQAETDAVDWAKVKDYAQKGITQDFSPVGDNNQWYTNWGYYANAPSWMRVDMRIIHEMDPNSPPEFTTCTAPPKATSADARLGTDIIYKPSIPFASARGCYHFSPWGYGREAAYGRDASSSTRYRGPYPLILKAENDLLIAEADVRLGANLGEAADLINITRVGRGHLAPVSAGDGAAALLKAIQYEQDVELLNTGAGLQFYDRRRINGLQPQTPLHLPVPAHELETDGLPVYTYGGPDNPDH